MMAKSLTPKMKIAVILTAVLLIAGGLFWRWQEIQKAPEIVIHEFAGNIDHVNGNSVFLKGNYFSDEHPELSMPDQIRTVEVVIAPGTKATKIMYSFPKEAEESGFFDYSKAEKTALEGSLEDMQAVGVQGMIVTAKDNIYGKVKFQADTFRYFGN